MKFSLPSSNKGFTLVELLVVIAVLGVLAAGVLVAINPLEQLARGRDTGRSSAINEMGRGLATYATSNAAGDYPTQDATWITQLVTSNDIKTAPTNPTGGSSYTIGCNTSGVAQNGYCFLKGTVSSRPEAIIYARAESASLVTKAACTSGQAAWIVYSTQAGRTGVMCTTNATTDPTVAGATSANIK